MNEKKYFYINSFFEVSEDENNGMAIDIKRKYCGNYFDDKETAKAFCEKIKKLINNCN